MEENFASSFLVKSGIHY